jgi:hypothetical protein
MDESVIKHLERSREQREGAPHKMSEALRIGAALCEPIRQKEFWNRRRCGACAVATAVVGHYGSFREAYKRRFEGCSGGGTLERVSKLFGVPEDVVLKASLNYEERGHTREQIADWLESQGY